MRRLTTLLLATVLGLSFTGVALAQGTLRIGMTASDIPYTGGQTDNGFEGFRFVGYQIYEPLINWDLTHSDRLPALTPGLAESWEVRKDAPTFTDIRLFYDALEKVLKGREKVVIDTNDVPVQQNLWWLPFDSLRAMLTRMMPQPKEP